MTVEEHLIIGYRRQIIDTLKILKGYCKSNEDCTSDCVYKDICDSIGSYKTPEAWHLPDPEDISFMKKEEDK